MKYIGWIVAFVSFIAASCVGVLNKNQARVINFQADRISYLEKEVCELEKKQDQIDWLESELEAIDRYILAVECLKIKGAESLPDNLEEDLRKRMNKERLKVIEKAVNFDRENK